MSARTLRRAAALMRERAQAATAGPWSLVPGAANVWHFPEEGAPAVVVKAIGRAVGMSDAEHIASWHPAVALAVADWLDVAADSPTCICDCHLADGDPHCEHSAALAVARAYLGEPAP